MKRRSFLSHSAKSTLGFSAAITASSAKRVLGANERIAIGLVGCGGRGTSLLRTYARDKRVQFAYMCDPDEKRGQREFAMLKEEHNPHLKRETDFRRILNDKSLDVLMIATPDHWHALATILACQAGLDVYVEKPMSHNIWEGRQMIKAARKYKRVVQVGMQSRSAPYIHKAIDYLRSGKLGDIHLCKIFNMKPGKPYRADTSYKPPKWVDVDLWLGAAREKYSYIYERKGWLYHWDFCNGDFMNDGVHQTDLARWLIDKTAPQSTHCAAGNLAFDDDREVPDTLNGTVVFDDVLVSLQETQYTPFMAKTPMVLRQSDEFPYWPQNSTRIELYGSKGFMIVGRHGGGWQVFTSDGEVVAQEYGRFPDEPHKENFIECLQTRERTNADVEEGHYSCLLIHTACISHRLGGKKLNFDAETERFDDKEANALLKREYRKGYEVPEKV